MQQNLNRDTSACAGHPGKAKRNEKLLVLLEAMVDPVRKPLALDAAPLLKAVAGLREVDVRVYDGRTRAPHSLCNPCVIDYRNEVCSVTAGPSRSIYPGVNSMRPVSH